MHWIKTHRLPALIIYDEVQQEVAICKHFLYFNSIEANDKKNHSYDLFGCYSFKQTTLNKQISMAMSYTISNIICKTDEKGSLNEQMEFEPNKNIVLNFSFPWKDCVYVMS